MQTLQTDYFAAYRNLKLSRDAKGVLVAEFHSDGGPFSAQQEVAQASPPPVPTPTGEAFAAAVIAGQLPPRPMTPEQLRQRLGSAWQPPASPLRLMDRSA